MTYCHSDLQAICRFELIGDDQLYLIVRFQSKGAGIFLK